MRHICHRYIRCAVLVFLVSSTQLSAAEPSPLGADIVMTINGNPQELTTSEQHYLIQAINQIYESCKIEERVSADSIEKDGSAELTMVTADGQHRTIQAATGNMQPGPKLLIYKEAGKQLDQLQDCSDASILPVASIIESHRLIAGDAIDLEPRRRTASSGRLSSYEPDRLGWAVDDNGVNYGYLDAVLSLKYRFFDFGKVRKNPALFFAFTTQFSQYIGTIDSSPVVARRYNPSLFSRWWWDDRTQYIDIGYAHESNGQSINTEEAYLSERDDFARSDNDANFARNYISRGWDYVSVGWANCGNRCLENQDIGNRAQRFNNRLMLKFFLDDGIFQGNPEEYNVWENEGEHRREQYDGVSFMSKYRWTDGCWLYGSLCAPELTWQYTTGYDDVFDHNTNRVEFTVNDFLFNASLMLWVQSGYNSNLVDYYADVDSAGISVVFESED